ncbi:MAG: hypothetical protein ABSC71_15845 [Candidatus Acidiferrales bacterium]
MLRRRLAYLAPTSLAAALLFCAGVAAPPARASECASHAGPQIEVNSSTPRSLDSPDKKWKLYSVPGHSFSDDASVFLSLADTNKKWRIVYLKRRGTAFFSDDSHWLVFRDDYLTVDSFILAFDLSGSAPKEIKRINTAVRDAIAARIPKGMMAEYVHYPDFCFATATTGAPTTVILLSDTPVLQRPTFYFGYGTHLGKGAPFFLTIEVTLPDAKATATPYTPTHPSSAAAPSPNATPPPQ